MPASRSGVGATHLALANRTRPQHCGHSQPGLEKPPPRPAAALSPAMMTSGDGEWGAHDGEKPPGGWISEKEIGIVISYWNASTSQSFWHQGCLTVFWFLPFRSSSVFTFTDILCLKFQPITCAITHSSQFPLQLALQSLEQLLRQQIRGSLPRPQPALLCASSIRIKVRPGVCSIHLYIWVSFSVLYIGLSLPSF